MIIVPRHIIPPPLGKRNRWSSRSKNRKRQNKQARQTRAIKRASNEVRVVLEDARAVVAQVKLREEADNDPTEEHARLRLIVGDVAGVLNELREVDLAEREVTDFGDPLGDDC
jgi:hypothetical protein